MSTLMSLIRWDSHKWGQQGETDYRTYKISHSSMSLYQEFLKKFIFEICRKNILQKHREK